MQQEQAMSIWLDVTSTLRWSRPPVGIIRTEIELIKFALRSEKVRFLRLDNASSVPAEVSKDDVESALCNLEEFTKSERFSLFSVWLKAKPVGNTTQRMRWKAYASYTNFPATIKRLISGLYNNSRGAAVSLNEGIFEQVSSNWSIVGKQDTLFSAGFLWEYCDPARIKFAREKYDFQFWSMCYDTIPDKFPEFVPDGMSSKFTNYLASLLAASSGIVTISETSKQDVQAFANAQGLNRELPIRVAYLGCDINESAGKNARVEDLSGVEYFLYVSTLEIRKNHKVLYEAYKQLQSRHQSGDLPTLVFVGMPGWNADETFDQIRNDSALLGQIRILNRVSDETLFWLYRNAVATVFPSFYEGWGLPIAESQALGTPVITSNSEALLEASQGLGVALDPNDSEKWAAEFEKFLDADYREERVKLLKSFRKPTWDEFASEVFRALEDASR